MLCRFRLGNKSLCGHVMYLKDCIFLAPMSQRVENITLHAIAMDILKVLSTEW